MKFANLAAFAAAVVLTAASGAAFASPALTTGNQPLLSGPGTDYAKLTDLPAKSHVNVVWCGTHQNWCLVSEHGRMGWVPMASLSHAAGGAPVAAGEADIATKGGAAGSIAGQPEGRAALNGSSSGGATAASAGSSASGKVGSGL